MRTLLYIPIIHSGADMGSMAAEISRKGVEEFGKDFWETHTSTVNKYWENIARYCRNLEIGADGLKIYQDGMVADGEIAVRIIEDSLKAGSKNYEIISGLVSRGAVVVRTEELWMVKKELEMLKTIPTSGALIVKIIRIFRFKILQSKLLKQRDKFIAGRIAETLGQDETGIIFLGAYHNILKYLPRDISVKEVKEISKIKEYQKLLPAQSREKLRFKALSEYLMN
jgi:hypothetical protein